MASRRSERRPGRETPSAPETAAGTRPGRRGSRTGRPGSPRARLFVALDLPDPARTELIEWRARAFGERPDVRLPAGETLHVTLVFLGYQPEKEIGRIARLMRSALPDAEAPVLTAAAVKPLPPRRPRLFALDLHDEDGRAGGIQLALSNAFERERLYKPEKRPFWPHLTLARVKREAIAAPFAGEPPPPEPWRARAVTLYRSTLRREGARYDALERVELRQAS